MIATLSPALAFGRRLEGISPRFESLASAISSPHSTANPWTSITIPPVSHHSSQRKRRRRSSALLLKEIFADLSNDGSSGSINNNKSKKQRSAPECGRKRKHSCIMIPPIPSDQDVLKKAKGTSLHPVLSPRTKRPRCEGKASRRRSAMRHRVDTQEFIDSVTSAPSSSSSSSSSKASLSGSVVWHKPLHYNFEEKNVSHPRPQGDEVQSHRALLPPHHKHHGQQLPVPHQQQQPRFLTSAQRAYQEQQERRRKVWSMYERQQKEAVLKMKKRREEERKKQAKLEAERRRKALEESEKELTALRKANYIYKENGERDYQQEILAFVMSL